MDDKNEIEIGYLDIFSWEHYAVTGDKYCHDVNQLKWLLPEETTLSFKQFMGLQQELFLSDCVPLNPLVDSKRKIFIKSKAFSKPLSEFTKEFFEKAFPGFAPLKALTNGYTSRSDFEQLWFVEGFEMKFSELREDVKLTQLDWEAYVLKNAGYRTRKFHEGKRGQTGYQFYVPSSNDLIKKYYSVIWTKHYYSDELLKSLSVQ
tara:strand:+ start:965 stop:1576 length:612 start_codon:yes stop_codon:yes gene_type:complete